MSIEEPVSQGLRRGLPGATVLQIVPALDSAADGQETLDAALKLVRAGARALVAGREGPLVPELQSFGGEWVALEEATRIWQLRRRRSFLESLIESERVDIIHARGRGPAKLAAAPAGGAAAIVVGCGAEALGPARDRRYGRALARADRVIVHSAFLAKRILATREVAQERIVEIPHAVETAQFDPAAVSVDRVLNLRQAWKLGPGVRVALVPGAIQPENGQHILVEAVRMLVSGGLRGLAFVLAGSRRNSAYAAVVQARAKAYGIGRTVRQVGVCTDMAAAYAAADFVVLPFIAAPSFSRTAAEAFAMGRPLVASAVGCLPEFVLAPPSSSESARTGWLVAAEDPVALARALAIAEGITAADLRTIGVQAWRSARELLSPARVANATLAVYASLLKSRS